jgi:hypothetical protein
MAKTEIDKRARGTSERLLHGYLAKKWFFSVRKQNVESRYTGICQVLKTHSYREILLEFIFVSLVVYVLDFIAWIRNMGLGTLSLHVSRNLRGLTEFK